MNTNLLVEHSKLIRSFNLVVFVVLVSIFILTDFTGMVLFVLCVHSVVNLVGQVSMSLKYQKYGVGPISSPFLGAELAGFSAMALAITFVPLPFDLNIDVSFMLVGSVFVFIVSSTAVFPYLWGSSGLTVIALSVVHLDREPYAPTAGVIAMAVTLGIVYVNERLRDKFSNMFVSFSGVDSLSVGESHIEGEFVNGKQVSEPTDSLWYCRIPLMNGEWVTLKEESKEDLKESLTSDSISGVEHKDTVCGFCGEPRSTVNMNSGRHCERTSWCFGRSSRTGICFTCSEEIFEEILEDESIEEFTPKEYLAEVI